MTWYVTQNGTPYQGDRQIRADGGWDTEIPDRPSPDYNWTGESWVQVPADYKWKKLKGLLRNTDLFGLAATTTAGNAFSMLLDVFESSDDDADRLADLQYALTAVRAGLETDYSPEQLERFRGFLNDCGIPSDWI